jgi:hypothetical protein
MSSRISRFGLRSLAWVAIVATSSSCRHPKPAAGAHPDDMRLGGIVGQVVLIAPVQSMRVVPELAWTGLPRTADVLASLDKAITDTLRARVGDPQWVYPNALIESARNNPTYATDPRALSVQPLKTAKLEIAQRLPEPLASQLRTMLALHDGRLILLPVELHFDRTAIGAAHPALRLVLVDPRLSEIKWFGEVAGLDTSTFSTTFTTQIAARIADLFVAK